MKKILLFILVLGCSYNVYSQTKMRVKDKITNEEKDFLLEVKKKYPDMPVTNNVIRYNTVDEFGNKEQIKTELVYDEIQYQDQFVYFSAYILDNKILTYEGSSGMAYTEYGNFTFAGEQLIKTSFGYGTESGTTEIYIDGKKIYEKEQNVN